jgi:hypothetical protein
MVSGRAGNCVFFPRPSKLSDFWMKYSTQSVDISTKAAKATRENGAPVSLILGS